MGQVAEELLGPRGRTLFHLIIFFGVALAMGVFVLVIAMLFERIPDPESDVPGYSTAVLPSALLMVVALVCGHLLYKRKLPLLPIIAVGFAIELIGVARLDHQTNHRSGVLLGEGVGRVVSDELAI